MKTLAIQKTVGEPPKDYNQWVKYISKESKKMRRKLKWQQ
jgi:hypothetical protein